MKLNLAARLSLKARLTLFTVVMFLLGIWTIALYGSSILRGDMERLLGEQQFSVVSMLAAHINDELVERLAALESVAKGVSPGGMKDSPHIQALLEQRPLLQNLFNGGVIAVDMNGTAVADVPIATGRKGVNYIDRENIAAAILEGKAGIGQPVVGRKLGNVVFSISAPIHDERGTVIGALVGTTDMSQPSFLDKVSAIPYGKKGGYVILSVRDRRTVAAYDKRRIMEKLPPVGINPLFDRYMVGYEGYGTTVDSLGLGVLSSAKQIPAAAWVLVARVPTEEAFAPISDMQRRVLLAAALLTLFAGGLTWWMTWRLLRQQLSPMIEATKAIGELSVANPRPHPLPVRNHDEIGELMGAFNDLLDKIGHRDRALAESEERYRELFANNASILMVIDPDSGAIVDANAAAAGFYGYPIEQLKTMTVQQINTLSPEEVAAERRRAVNSQRNYFVFPHRLADGQIRVVEVTSTPITVSGRRLLFSIITDTTERNRAESALRESESRLGAVFNGSPIGIAVTTLEDGRFLDINEAALQSLGYRRDEIIGRNTRDLALFVHEAQRDEGMRRLREFGKLDQFPAEFRKKSGETGLLSYYGRVVDIRGERCVVSMWLDLTERRRLEELHLQAQKLESLGTLAGGIAHDFNNILAAIRGNADLAAEDAASNPVVAECIEEIRKASVRAGELVRRITTFARPKEINRSEVDLRTVVTEVLKLLRASLPAAINLHTEFGEDACAVLADAGQVHEAIVNLATNAAHAIGPHPGTISFRLENADIRDDYPMRIPGLKSGRYVCLVVEDSGCGMDAATLDRIFDAFYTTKPPGEGTGLGLSMVHGIMKGHGGAVTVESVPGKGTTFRLYFAVSTMAGQ